MPGFLYSCVSNNTSGLHTINGGEFSGFCLPLATYFLKSLLLPFKFLHSFVFLIQIFLKLWGPTKSWECLQKLHKLNKYIVASYISSSSSVFFDCSLLSYFVFPWNSMSNNTSGESGSFYTENGGAGEGLAKPPSSTTELLGQFHSPNSLTSTTTNNSNGSNNEPPPAKKKRNLPGNPGNFNYLINKSFNFNFLIITSIILLYFLLISIISFNLKRFDFIYTFILMACKLCIYVYYIVEEIDWVFIILIN